MTFRCPKCGFHDNPMWKPLYWKPYYAYADYEDFKRDYPALAKDLTREKPAEDEQYLYYLRGKTRVMVHRIDKLFLHLTDKTIFEKTPSEKNNRETGRAYKSGRP